MEKFKMQKNHSLSAKDDFFPKVVITHNLKEMNT